MTSRRRRRLNSTVTLVQQRYGPRALQRGSARAVPQAIPTGFAALDALTGCGGIPLGALTLLTGTATSGKLTLAYKALANAQQAPTLVALLDLARRTDPDYLARCGVDLAALVIARPGVGQPVLPLLLDLVRSRRLGAVLVDSLADLTTDRRARRSLSGDLARLAQVLQGMACAVLLLDEVRPPWQRGLPGSLAVGSHVALHIELRREEWLEQDGRLHGYEAQARLVKSRWARAGAASIAIVFNGTVRAREDWG